MSPGKSFSAPYDTAAKVVSAVVCLLPAGLAIATHSLILGCLPALGMASHRAHKWLCQRALPQRVVSISQRPEGSDVPADGRRLVLFPPKGDGAAVLMEAADPRCARAPGAGVVVRASQLTGMLAGSSGFVPQVNSWRLV